VVTRIIILCFALGCANTVFSQGRLNQYYVVIGAFKIEQNAINFKTRASQRGHDAVYTFNANRQLYYVYIFTNTESKKAYAKALYTRLNTSYRDAWVYFGNLNARTDVATSLITEPVVLETPVKPLLAQTDSVLVVNAEKKLPEVINKPKGKPFRFVLKNESTAEQISGKLSVLESTKSNAQLLLAAHEVVYLDAPRNREKRYLITSLAPGYIESSLAVDYLSPEKTGATKDSTGVYVFEIALERVKLGDYIEFHHVSFFPNTGILKPESQAELDGLAEMLKDHPKYKIAIHAHCNGKEKRDIISRGKSVEFFMPHPDNNREYGSAKRLTELMAEAVKDYLITQGIDESRIKTKGEGAVYMIYPQKNARADLNNRVEIEVTRGK
jgi:outer membrane protein OmpA-like peptidoglycan-associated protein